MDQTALASWSKWSCFEQPPHAAPNKRSRFSNARATNYQPGYDRDRGYRMAKLAVVYAHAHLSAPPLARSRAVLLRRAH
ncbi:hypothetical protein [Amycolatopsis anabasis]|uniref:hypothetical protein n=1 Tax=Amycolatopsis anabasis TaxID=1840409 RepID=UPI00131D5FB1|nr:hypothetical protein [Amycolatopsis anabasis]